MATINILLYYRKNTLGSTVSIFRYILYETNFIGFSRFFATP